MLNQRQLWEQKDLYIYYKKVINLKRIKLQRQIEDYRDQVSFVKDTIKSMKNIKELLNKESNFLSFFEKKKQNNPKHLKDIFIFIQTKDDTNIGKYSDKKILEYIQKKIDLTNDIVYVLGLRLFGKIKSNFQDLNIQLLEDFIKGSNYKTKNYFSVLFEKISEISFTLYSDQIINSVSLLYSDIEKSKKLFVFTILQFDLNNIKVDKSDLSYSKPKTNDAKKIFSDFSIDKINKVTFNSQIININETFLKLLLSSISKYIVINYLLNMCIRKIITIDDEQKNLDQRIKKNDMQLLKIKNEKLTNEMIQISVARKIIIKRKKQELMNINQKRRKMADE